jgi:hypothetical protein
MATKLKKLTLNEVSLVDRGANQHAHITLFKRDAGDDSLQGKIGEATAALAKSIDSIIADDKADRPSALAETFKQYHDHLQTMVPAGVTDAVTAALAAHTPVSKDDDMNDKIEDVKKQLEDAQAALVKATKEVAFHKLSDAHKAYVAEKALSDEDRDAFVAKSEADREAQIKAAPVEKKVDPEIAKRDQELADLRKRLEATEEKNIVADFAKKAVDLGLPEAKGETLRKAYGGDKTAQGEVEALIKGLTEQVKTGKVFEEFGTKVGVDATSPKAKVDAKVAEMQKTEPTLTRPQAIAKIASDPSQRELWNEYKAAGAAA